MSSNSDGKHLKLPVTYPASSSLKHRMGNGDFISNSGYHNANGGLWSSTVSDVISEEETLNGPSTYLLRIAGEGSYTFTSEALRVNGYNVRCIKH